MTICDNGGSGSWISKTGTLWTATGVALVNIRTLSYSHFSDNILIIIIVTA